MPSTTTKRTILGVFATLALVASAVCFAWAAFAAIFASGIFAGGDSHPPEPPDVLTPIVLGVVSAAVGVLALVRWARRSSRGT